MTDLKRLALLLTLGLALGLAGCGGDDDDGDNGGGGNGGDGGCPGSNATLAGHCLATNGYCWEGRGEWPTDPAADCATEGSTWAAGEECPATSKTSGACVVEIVGSVAVSYDPSSTPTDWQTGCESTGLGCYIAP